MTTKASVGGHPIHPMLVAFPIGLWITSFAVDILFYLVRQSTLLIISKFLIAAGCIGAVAAAIPGIIDWWTLKDPNVVRVANWHARLNIAALVVFAISLYLRMQSHGHLVGHRLMIPFVVSLVGVILIGISGWLGGELVYKHRVGVEFGE
ncbi:MAG TPA: DUF2231 domain-containing protein [Pyrinomonadaceae bacterium]|jgi:uncharacterized membrane protein|nr:DUF2231 domain-containing protein [Pyrinomonadaceae bacterium]